MMPQPKHLLSIDLEDWFHLLDTDLTRAPRTWRRFPSRVEANTRRLLDLFDVHGVRTTFFVLGWVAESYPRLVEEVLRRGHEIGCHSYAHPLIYEMTVKQFEADLKKSLTILKDIVGDDVRCYRAPGFSITKGCEWAFDVLANNGIEYDSSVFPASRAHGGLPGYRKYPFVLETKYGRINEYPISTANVLGKGIAFAGGGYFRLMPLWFIDGQFRRYDANGAPVIGYLHPRDIDAGQPILPLKPMRLFRSYVNLSGTFKKLDLLLGRHRFTHLTNIKIESGTGRKRSGTGQIAHE